MAVTTPRPRLRSDRAAPANGSVAAAAADRGAPRFQAFALMRASFTIAPIAFGLDKFARLAAVYDAPRRPR